QIICFTYLFFCISNVLIASLRCIGTVRLGLYTSIVSFLLNVSLNWILIFGHFGAPALGVRGAAIATLVTRIVEFMIIVGYLLFIDKKLLLRIKDLYHFNQVLFKDFFRYGLPVILGDI